MAEQTITASSAIGPVPLRVGIVGCGRVTETCHLPAVQTLGGYIRVIAVADTDEHRRRRVAGMFNIAATFVNLESMLRDAKVDAVAICTPASSHADAVIAALRAGKHVLVEKPLALTLDDADRIVAEAAAHRDLKLMVGFNLRHHRLVRAAKKMIDNGVLGELHLVRTLWTSGIRSWMKLPAWRCRRETGGGVLAEIAIHHVDLVRYLTGKDVIEVYAQTRHGEGDDETAGVVLQLDGGVTATSAFSDLSGDANELEFIGSKGRLAFSIYRFDSLTFTPAGSDGGRIGQTTATLKQLRQAWPILRRGGDFKESHRQEWIAFVDAVRNIQQITATAEDGREALRVVLAAGVSANAGHPVPVAEAPRQPQPVPGRTPVVAVPAATDPAGPQISAVISTPGNFDSIRRTIHHLRAQTVQNQIELVVVCTSKRELGLDESEMHGFWGHRIVEIGPFDSVAISNAAGTVAAAAPVVVFCEDHAFPDPDWAQSLIIAHRGPYTVVGPAVHNANPDTLVSRADFLIGYGPWAEPIRPCEPEHLPGHNSAYKRAVLLAYGDRLREMLEAESVLQWDLRAKGHRLYLDPLARVAHTNFAMFGVWTKVQFHAGRVFGGTRAMNWRILKRLFYAAASPLIPLVRLKRIWAQSRRLRGSQTMSPQLLAVLLWGLTLDGVGQMLGYLWGAGPSKGIAHEFCRVHHITEDDRQQLQAAEPANLH